jgi:hypothetical protein
MDNRFKSLSSQVRVPGSTPGMLTICTDGRTVMHLPLKQADEGSTPSRYTIWIVSQAAYGDRSQNDISLVRIQYGPPYERMDKKLSRRPFKAEYRERYPVRPPNDCNYIRTMLN